MRQTERKCVLITPSVGIYVATDRQKSSFVYGIVIVDQFNSYSDSDLWISLILIVSSSD